MEGVNKISIRYNLCMDQKDQPGFQGQNQPSPPLQQTSVENGVNQVAQQTPDAPFESPDTPQSKHNWLALVLGVALVVVLGVAGFFAYKYFQSENDAPVQEEKTPVVSLPTSVPDPTANWETYTSVVHGVTFKYPSTWVLVEELSEFKCGLNQDVICNTSVTLTKNNTTIGMTLNLDGVGGVGQNYDGVAYTLAGYDLYKFSLTNVDTNTKSVAITSSLTNSIGVFEVEGITYSVGMTYPIEYSGEMEDQLLIEFDDILSTFKFTQTSNTKADWSSYSNAQYNFSFSHPDTVNVSEVHSKYVNVIGASVVMPILISDNPDNLPLKDFFANYSNSTVSEIEKNTNISEFEVGDTKGLRIVQSKDFYTQQSTPYTNYLVATGNTVVIIKSNEYEGKSAVGEVTLASVSDSSTTALIQEILSSFKFNN